MKFNLTVKALKDLRIQLGVPQEEIITLMAIDDDASMLRMLKSMLGDEYNMILAPSGEKALKLMERKKPDIILLDYEMPGMNVFFSRS